MKKVVITVFAFLLSAALLTACGKSADGGGEETTVAANALYAEVIDVVSNQLTLKVLSGSFDLNQMAERMSEMQSRMSGGEGGGFFRGGEGATDASGETVTRPAPQTDADGNMVTRNRTPQTDAEGNTVTRPAQTDAEGNTVTRPAQTDAEGNTVTMPSRYTGEEKTLLIPVGTAVKTISFADGALQTKDAELADIKNGATVNIIYSDNGTSVKEVQILNIGGRGGAGGGGMVFGGAGGEGGPPQLPEGAVVNPAPDGGVQVIVPPPEG
ncbi:MAG: hypothetical protein LBG83_03680 [Oscillospiraceae bacterium]|jgi:predicted small secreted protein|nr:hypothetical protein [Oscillospiraceae bacterium]